MYDFVKLENLVEVHLGDGKVLKATGRGTVTLFTVLPGGKHKKNLSFRTCCLSLS